MPDDALHDALCFHLLVIGEVVKHLDPETSRQAPEVQWQRIAGLRDVIVYDSQNDHDGFDIFGAGGNITAPVRRGAAWRVLRYGDATPAHNGGIEAKPEPEL